MPEQDIKYSQTKLLFIPPKQRMLKKPKAKSWMVLLPGSTKVKS